MELFRDDGHLSDEGLRAVCAGSLDELGRLEAAEHLSYCNECLDRYTALLTADALETPPTDVRGAVIGSVWVRVMQNTAGRAAVAGVAAVLALTMWRTGALELMLSPPDIDVQLPSAVSQLRRNESSPLEVTPSKLPDRLGKPIEDDDHTAKPDLKQKLAGVLDTLLADRDAASADGTAQTDK